MTRKIKPIVRGKIIVWPLIPRLTAGVKLHDQSDHCGDWTNANMVILPMIKVTPKRNPPPSYNDIQKVLAKTMRDQRYTKRSQYALEKLRKMHLNPG